MRSLISAGLLALFSIAAQPVRADSSPFSGSGTSGTLVGPGETWTLNFDGGSDWGSPGVGAGTALYGESAAAYGMTISFAGGGLIDASLVALGNSSNCNGGPGSGPTSFCTLGPDHTWLATQTGPNSVEFLAQNPSSSLSQGQSYFVNIFFDGDTPSSFSGAWLTSFTPIATPEPTSLSMLGIGLIGLGLLRLRKTTLSPASKRFQESFVSHEMFITYGT